MQCPDEEILELFALGRLPDADPELEEHVLSCEACQRYAKETREWVKYLKWALEVSER